MLYPEGRGKYAKEAKVLWKKLVPATGQAKTVQGESIRCVVRLGDEMYRNGNGNWDEGFEIMVEFLREVLCDGTFEPEVTQQIRADLKSILAGGKDPDKDAMAKGEDPYDRITDRVVEWINKHPKRIPHKANRLLKR